MECIEARALKKSSFFSEFAMNSTQQVMFDDFLYVNGLSGVSSDDFSVDGFLDLSNDDFEDEFVREEEESEEEKDSLSTSSSDRAEDEIYHSSGAGDCLSLPTDELAVPVDDLENLEWLSQFVDDSASELSLLCPADNYNEKTGFCSVNRIEPVIQIPTPVLCFPSPVPAKARTKRPRPSGRAWSGGSSSSTLSTSCENSPTSILIFSNQFQTDLAEEVVKLPAKKMKKRPAAEDGGNAGGPQTQRWCSHCKVQKTPQWRNGPLGPKTLCNACGVRFKSGRLFPEYRPACSPTFSGEYHSNSHRKVLEMRRKKDLTGAGDGRVMNSAKTALD